MAVSLTFQPLEAKRIASENDGVGTNLVRRLDQKTVKCCNEKLCGRTISLIDSFSWLLSFVSGKQAADYPKVWPFPTKRLATQEKAGESALQASLRGLAEAR